MTRKIKDCDVHKGHRGRMRRKLDEYGGDIFDTYELLEMLLYGRIANGDTNPLAKELLRSFGSLDGVFSANREELVSVNGIGEKTAELILAVAELDRLRAEPHDGAVERFDDFLAVGEYFSGLLREAGDYRVLALFLDNSMRPIGVRTLYEGLDFKSGGVRASAFVTGAISMGAAVVMVAHNHPFGPAFPSEGDLATTDAVYSALSGVGVILAEHYLVSGDSFVGIMKEIKRQVRQRPELERFFDSKKKYLGGGEL